MAEECTAATAADVRPRGGWRGLVGGDVSLDEYIYGRATRLSREAPVPVLEWCRREVIPGAAANPACNIVAAGSSAVLVGVVGNDDAGEQLHAALRARGIDTTGLLHLPDRSTTTKTRILADEAPRLPQQVARIDRIDRGALAAASEQRVLAMLADAIPTVDAVLCSDYQLGLLTPAVVDAVRTACRRAGVVLTVDAQGNSHSYQGVDLFRCNNVEASAALGRTLQSEEDYAVGVVQLREQLGARAVMVTRGPRGLALADEQGYCTQAAAHVSEVYDTTGAGDTFIAIATLALAGGLSARVAATLANTAAALTVRRLGNSVVMQGELAAALAARQQVPE